MHNIILYVKINLLLLNDNNLIIILLCVIECSFKIYD